MKLKILCTALVCVLLTACSDPKEYKLPEKISTITEDASFQKKIEKLSEEEKNLFAGYAMRAMMAESFGKKVANAGTVGEAIAFQKTWLNEQQAEKAKQQAIKDEALKKRSDALAVMNAALTTSLISVQLISKNYEKKIYSDYFKIELAVKNNSTDDLSGFKGAVVLKDMFGSQVKAIGISTSTPIPAGESIIYSADFPHNQFMDEDKKLATLSADKLQYEWTPDMYIFKDGKKLSMPN
jgi:hypothetical protein